MLFVTDSGRDSSFRAEKVPFLKIFFSYTKGCIAFETMKVVQSVFAQETFLPHHFLHPPQSYEMKSAT
jgi:hypothetical protein